MPSKEYLIASRDAYMRRAQVAEKRQRLAHENAKVLIKFISDNCSSLEVTSSWSQNVNVLQIDDRYYMIEPQARDMLQ